MLNIILSSLYFILPTYVANACPVLLQWLPFGQPISKNLFGDHKTWRGFYTGYFGALVTLLLQFYLQKSGFLPSGSLISNSSILSAASGNSYITPLLDYEHINLLLYSFIFGIGALTGDLIKSFFKRRLNVSPGQSWFPFDQLDFIVGALIFISPFYIPVWSVILTILIISPLIHISANFIAFHLKLKKVWW
ncbi:MAG: CDP-archaeol synthase [Candidatus Peregrinibacteria bacterium]|nr:CDP-archaeol synthase [Candidatus Peregrinibacteria bacterium]